MLGGLQHQQDTQSLHQELSRIVEDDPRGGQFHANCPSYHQVQYLKGDALSPLLFCVGLNSLSHIITKSGCRYRFQSGPISHLLYRDNIKLYARTELDIDSWINLTKIYSKDIGMLFGLDKFGRMIPKSGCLPLCSTPSSFNNIL